MRKAFLYKLSIDETTAVFIDEENAKHIQVFLYKAGNRKKFNYIVECILEGISNNEIYSREFVENIRNVTAMKAFKHGNNPRIYCQEIMINEKTTCVVCCKYLPKKKTEGVTGETLQVVKQASGYQYSPEQLEREIQDEIKKRKENANKKIS